MMGMVLAAVWADYILYPSKATGRQQLLVPRWMVWDPNVDNQKFSFVLTDPTSGNKLPQDYVVSRDWRHWVDWLLHTAVYLGMLVGFTALLGVAVPLWVYAASVVIHTLAHRTPALLVFHRFLRRTKAERELPSIVVAAGTCLLSLI